MILNDFLQHHSTKTLYMPKPDLSKIPTFFHRYVNLVKEEDIPTALANNLSEAVALLTDIPDEQWDFRYAEGKWSIKEMVQHMIDAERIFAYRALCIARGEKQSLPSFEENDYAAASNADKRTKSALLDEFTVVRVSTEALYRSLDEAQLNQMGVANNNPITAAGIGFITVGHVMHHLNVLRERYLNK